MSKFDFPKQSRLLRGAEFQRVFRDGCAAAHALMVVHGCKSATGRPRMGLAVSRRHGGAVRRNRWKRALREAFRLCQHQLPPLDLVVLPQRGAEPDLPLLRAALVKLARRIQRKLN